MPVSLAPSSAAGLLALLHEPEPELQQLALGQLDAVVDAFWPEISESLVLIETLSESAALPLPTRQLAALLTSKLYFHLSAPDEALHFALRAGPAFERAREAVVAGQGAGREGFVEVVTGKALDSYIALRQASASPPPASAPTFSPADVESLEAILSSIVAHSLGAREPHHALGLALEARRADLVRKVWEESGRDGRLLSWVLAVVADGGRGAGGRAFRVEILELLLDLIPLSTSASSTSSQAPDYASLLQIHVLLARPSLSASLIAALLGPAGAGDDADGRAWAYQCAFDLAESADQAYLSHVSRELCGETSDAEPAVKTELRKILSGETAIRLYLEFLHKNDRKDLLILQTTKDALESRSSMYHSALTLSHAFMSSGTTSDTFLRNNLDFLSRASHWSKFNATAALGVINKGSLARGRALLGPYLPGAGGAGGAGKEYSEGGALFAVGLINAGRGGQEGEWLKGQLRDAEDEVVKHGAALGLGVAGLASGDEDIYDLLRETLFQDSAVAGEAAGYAMGLVHLSSGSVRAHDEMVQYARETQHEKIIRGLAVGVGFLWAGRGEEADGVIEGLLNEKDAILRYGGMYTIALAYAGTSSNGAIKRLLSVAVSDVTDDVRRAAVTALGFVLCRNPTQVPRIVQLLSESYNPHVRQGAALALGVACAGTGLPEAIELLEPLTKDPVDFVRQGALIALALVLIQQSPAQSPAVNAARTKFASVIADKHEDSMAKFGAALAQGIIDAGGRNVTVSLVGRGGAVNMNAAVGMALFCQFWFWFPLANCLSLGFAPTALIGLDADLKIPKFEFVSKAKPSAFAYPPPTKVKEKEEVKAVATAVLSTTAKANARERERKKEKEGEAMDTDEKDDAKPPAVADDKMDTADADEKTALLASTDDAKPPSTAAPAAAGGKKAEPSTETLPNMSRVTPAQAAVVSFPPSSTYLPLREVGSHKGKTTAGGQRTAGIILVKRNKDVLATEPEFIELDKSLDKVEPAPVPAAAAAAGDVDMGVTAAPAAEEREREPPASFEFPFTD